MDTSSRRSLHRRVQALLAVALLGALAACNVAQPAQDDPTRYFILSLPLAKPGAAAPVGTLRVGLRSVALDPYLKRREFVVRTAENEVQLKEYRLWAEPLDTAIGRVLRGQLIAQGGVSEVFREPFAPDQARDYDVSVEVRSCEGRVDASGNTSAHFSAVVEVWSTGASPELLVRREFVAPRSAWNGSDYGQLAALLSTDVAALASEILSDLPRK